MESFLYLTKEECRELINYAENLNNWWRREEGLLKYYRVKFKPPLLYKNKLLNYCKEILQLDITDINVGVIKYIEGDEFPIHIDKLPTEFNHDFIYNINVRLNDDFEGGNFILDNKIVDNEVGHIYHYSSSIPHGVTKITKGIRYLALFYIRQRDIFKKDKKSII